MKGKKKIISLLLVFMMAAFYFPPVRAVAYGTDGQSANTAGLQSQTASEEQVTGENQAGDEDQAAEVKQPVEGEQATGVEQAAEGNQNRDSEESLTEIKELLTAHDAKGREIDIDSLDKDAYDGYVFKLNREGRKTVSAKDVEKESGGEIKYADRSKVFVADSLEAIDETVDAGEIDYIEPNYTYETSNDLADYSPEPNDKYYNEQWNLTMMKVAEAWKMGQYGQCDKYSNKDKVTVAVVDSGLIGTGDGSTVGHEDIDYSHVQDGVNLVNSKKGTPDETGHGTFVSGLIFAENNNDLGISGIMPEAEILPIKVFGASNSTSMSTVTEGIYAAIEAKADVINLSLGSEYAAETEKAACEAAVARGILVVAAAGNDGNSVKNYPAAHDCVVGVASLDSTGEPSYFSQYGKSVYVAAPGGSVRSLSHNQKDGYKIASGTSFSSPEVAALGAMTKSVLPDTNQYDFMEMLKETSEDKGKEGFDDYYGYGLVDFGASARHIMGKAYQPIYNISFNVADEEGQAINDAEIEVTTAEELSWDDDAEAGVKAGKWPEGFSVKAESDGTYKLHKGKYRYTIKRNGYLAVKGEFTTLSKEQNIKQTLERTFDTKFNIKDTDKDIIDDAHINFVRKKDNLEINVSQDGNGDYRAKLPKGSYSCTVTADGYNSHKSTMTIDGSKDEEDIVLYIKNQTCTVTFSFWKDNGSGSDPETVTEGATLKVFDRNNNEIIPLDSTTYELVKGHSYIYKTGAAGYESESCKFKVDKEDSMHIKVSMKQIMCSVEFKITDKSKVLLGDAELQVFDADSNEMSPEKGEPLRYNLPQGKYSYTISCNGYGTKRGMFTAKRQHQDFAVKMTGCEYELRVRCVNSEGNEIANADISITDEENNLRKAGSDGLYYLEKGDYKIEAFADGYEYAEADKSITDKDENVSILMTESGTTAAHYSGGDGSKANPYLISNESDLKELSENTRLVFANNKKAETNRKDSIDGYYRQVKDIVLTEPFEPIGNFESSDNYALFAGNYEGAGHGISGLVVNRKDQNGNGLFGAVRACEISNLTVRGNINSGSYTGGIAGMIFYDSEPTKIRECEFDGPVRGTSYVGGLVGYISADTSVKVNCYISSSCHKGGQVRAINPAGISANTVDNKVAGGIIGEGRALEITDCYNLEDVSSEYVVGGIAGRLQKNTFAYDLYSTGEIKEYGSDTSKKFRGGIVGDLYGNIDTGFYRKPTGVNSSVGSIQTEASEVNTEGRYEQDLKANPMTVNELNKRKGNITNSFCLTDEYPALSWERVAEKKTYASKPEILSATGNMEYTAGSGPADPIKVKAKVNAGDKLSYQWYENDVESASFAEKIEGAGGQVGTDGEISYTPDISSVGSKYYFAKITNTVGDGDSKVKSSIYTNIVEIAVKSDLVPVSPTVDNAGLREKDSGKILGTDFECYTEDDKQYEAFADCSVTDGGKLTYQWYVSEYANTKGKPVSGGNTNLIPIDTSEDGIHYYYLSVRNTLKNDRGESVSNPVKSSRIKVSVIDRQKREAEEAAAKTEATPGRVTGLSLKRLNYSSFALSWNSESKAESYQIYRIRNGESSYRLLATVPSGTSYKDAGLPLGYTYSYLVRATNTYNYKYSDKSETVYGPYSAAVIGTTNLGSPWLSLKAGKKKAYISWGWVDGATGYKIYRSTKKNKGYKCIKTIKSGSTTKYTNKKLKKKRTYYYKVLPYRKVGKKNVYGSYSAIKSVKAK